MRRVWPPDTLLSRFSPCGLFLVPRVEINPKRLPISDGRGDRRNFDTRPSRHPAKYIPGRVPKRGGGKKTSWERCINSGGEYFEEENSD
jgi:hypothetical protein